MRLVWASLGLRRGLWLCRRLVALKLVLALRLHKLSRHFGLVRIHSLLRPQLLLLLRHLRGRTARLTVELGICGDAVASTVL